MNVLEIGADKATEIVRKTFEDDSIPGEDKFLALDFPDTWREVKRAAKAHYDAMEDGIDKMIFGLGENYD